MIVPQIVVVENETIDAQNIKDDLESLGYRIPAMASSGEEAMSRISETHPDLVLMDMQLKGSMDGIAAGERIKMDFDIPVVYLSSSLDKKTMKRAQKSSPYGYVVKPFEKMNLHSTIELALYKHKNERKEKHWTDITGKIFEKAPIGMALMDMNFRIRLINRAFTKVTGRKSSELLGFSFFTSFHPADVKKEKEQISSRLRKEGDTYTTEIQYRKKRGILLFSVTMSIMRDDDNGALCYCAMVEDITERKRIEDEMEESKKRAQSFAKHILAFLADMSHEIRTPLSTIIGYSNLMLMGELPRDNREYCQHIKDSGNLLLSLINDILDQSKIDAGQVQIEHIPFSLETVMKNIESNAEILLSQRDMSISFRKSFPDNISRIIEGDPVRLTQVLNNLISNAVKFTDKGFIEFGISLKGRTKLEFYVRDTGIGISPENREKIFEPFQQAESSTTRKYGGTGLGLAITKRFVELMGGEINVISNTGTRHGSTFFFTMPYKKSSGIPEAECRKPAPQGNGKPLKVLLVEDNITNQKIIQRLMENMGCSVDVASDGREAISRFKSEKSIDLIFMDIRLPVMDGIKTTRIIRKIEEKNGKKKRIPIIALSAASMLEDEKKCLAAGCDSYITKPVSHDILISTLDKYQK